VKDSILKAAKRYNDDPTVRSEKVSLIFVEGTALQKRIVSEGGIAAKDADIKTLSEKIWP